MIDSTPDRSDAEAPGGRTRWLHRGLLGAVCVLVIVVYARTARSGYLESLSLNAADTHYNLLVQGFRAGQLSLKKEVPPRFTQLADPYDPIANAPYRSEPHRMLDLSYYKGRLYLYFGVTPALILFWPFTALTGHYLFHRQAVAIFCALGFLASVALLCALWRRYFAEVSLGVVAACVLALGLTAGVPVLLSRSEVYEVSISCGYMLTMLALGAIWRALHDPERRWRWLATASAAYGFALGARPNLLFGAVILLAPVAQAWRERKQIGTLLTAVTGPILLIGLALMLYNALRFDNPFEFGVRYQLTPDRPRQYFGLHYFWFNFRAYFLAPARWSGHFPFVHSLAVSPMPPGHGPVETPFGVLANIPLVWLALAVPLAWGGRSAASRSILRRFLAAVALLLGICALTVGLFFATCFRYEMEFLPALVLLATVGILGLERTLAGWPVWRSVLRWGWGVLLGFSVAFNLCAGVENSAEAYNNLGVTLSKAGRVQEAIGQWEHALRIKPDFAEVHYNLGLTLVRLDKVPEAMAHWEQALRIKPDYVEAHNNLGIALQQAGRTQEAMAHWEQALRIRPEYAIAHYNLGVALEQAGKTEDAIGHYDQALKIQPDYTAAQNRLGRLRVVR